MHYTIQASPAFTREFDRLPRAIQVRITAKVDQLAEQPYPLGTKKLQGNKDAWRIRVGDYRIVYRVENAVLTILLLRVGHRREIYRQ